MSVGRLAIKYDNGFFRTDRIALSAESVNVQIFKIRLILRSVVISQQEGE